MPLYRRRSPKNSCVATLSVLVFVTFFTGMVYLTSTRWRHYISTPEYATWGDRASTAVTHTINDHIYFSSFDGQSVYTNRGMTGGCNKRAPHSLEYEMLRKVRLEVIMFLATKGGNFYTKDNCRHIRYRDVPGVGVEVDVVCRRPELTLAERVTVLYPLQASLVTLHTQVATTERINIIMPLKGRPEIFKLFLNNLQKVIASGNVKVGLTVVCFFDKYTEDNRLAFLEAAKNMTDLQTHFIELPQQSFSRSKALNVGVEQSEIEGEVVFLCDVDVLFTSDFLLRCLTMPVQNHQVFFPIVFSQYNPELVFSLFGKKVPPPLDTLFIDDHSGFWRLWGHGMVCLYKSDFLKISGLNSARNGWGGEDLKFLEKTSKMKYYKIIRSLDYGLFHIYHPKDCKDVGQGMMWSCKSLQAMSEASNVDFGLWFFRKGYNSSLWGILKTEEEWERKVSDEWDRKVDVEWERNAADEQEREVDGKLEEVQEEDIIPAPSRAQPNLNTHLCSVT
ncbi:hypothetical protein Pcinc_016040 [Petrolisthes cinctipes]|uniref:Hexosyltransferase n=1 Tax=Petrolisthes cinctipes TaxID=88211 RepID=A0AAE1KPW3_PETCI|nr:hypothetical protein Pcinc_016040 [Petrolisthes cinctipes]